MLFAVAHFLGRWVRALHSLFVAPSLRFAQVLRHSVPRTSMCICGEWYRRNLSTLPMLHLLGGFFRPALVWHTSNALCRTWHSVIITHIYQSILKSNSEVQYTYPLKIDGQFWGTGWRYLSVQIAFKGGIFYMAKIWPRPLCLYLLLTVSLYIHSQVYNHAHSTLYAVFCATIYTICSICIHCIHEHKRKKAHIA